MNATLQNPQPVQMWNGKEFSYHTAEQAAKLEAAGTHERTAGVDANKLKPTFKKRRGRPPKDKGQPYKTTEMKAEK